MYVEISYKIGLIFVGTSNSTYKLKSYLVGLIIPDLKP